MVGTSSSDMPAVGSSSRRTSGSSASRMPSSSLRFSPWARSPAGALHLRLEQHGFEELVGPVLELREAAVVPPGVEPEPAAGLDGQADVFKHA